VLIGEATNTIFIVFGLTRPVLEPTIYRTRAEPTEYIEDGTLFDYMVEGAYAIVFQASNTSELLDKNL